METAAFKRFATHPVVLILASLVACVLWMPFGMGYYGFRWGDPFAVLVLIVFVFGFPVAAITACARSWSPRLLPFRLGVSALSVLVSLYGLIHMLHWWLIVVPKYDW